MTGGHDIGWAIDRLRGGHQVRRKAWPGGMALRYVPAPLDSPEGHSQILPGIFLCTATGDMVRWEFSQGDVLAADWEGLAE